MDNAQPTSKSFRVIVVGAGIVGLTLSHSLQHASIDHVVLEKYAISSTARGASLVILPNGARVLDQIGVLSKIHQTTMPVETEYRRWPDGSLNTQGSIMTTLNKLFDLPSVVFDRHSCVSQLYESLPDQSFIRTKKQVSHIEHIKEGVRVHLSDGTVEEGDIVIGADGIHSTVRQEMWNFAKTCLPNMIPESDKALFLREYNAVFGVSEPRDEHCLSSAETNVVYGHGTTQFLFTQPGVTYWLLVFKSTLHRASEESTATQNLEAIAHQFKDRDFTDKVKFSDLWATRTRAGLVDLEEGILSQWHAGSIVLIGDSAHKVSWREVAVRILGKLIDCVIKMTADLGLGANVGIEDAASICNILHRELATSGVGHPSSREITSMFAEFQAERYKRVKALVELSGKATRIHTYDSFFGRIFVGYLAPYLTKYQVMSLAKVLAKGPKLSFVPVRTINENAKGWRLAERDRGNCLAMYLVQGVAGVAVAYMILSQAGLFCW